MSDTMLFLEAESFEQIGGWVIDQQFMDEMGSPFLLAHGLGRPVEDAVKTVVIPASTPYRVWVRTRDWVGEWKGENVRETLRAQGAPGIFKVLINDEPLASTFGVEGKDWHWQDGGMAHLEAGANRVSLHDLTGLEGRCDAVLLSSDLAFTPPNDLVELSAFRRTCLGLPATPSDAGAYDLVVVGGGIAGICAAVAAARCDLSVAMIQDRPVVGGNNSSEVRVWLGGSANGARFPRVGDVLHEFEQERKAHYGPTNTADLYEDEKKLQVLNEEPNIDLFVNCRANAVEVRGGRIAAVIAQNVTTGERLRFSGRWFADCTGDAAIGALAGAEYDMTRKGHMGRCNLWNVKETDAPVPFPRCPWALDLSDKPFPGRDGQGGIEQLGGWYWESGFDRDPITDREAIRDWNFRAMYGAWDALKNVQKLYPNHTLNWAAHIAGPRESRRLMGDIELTAEDLFAERQFEDGCVATGWEIDVHLPEKQYEAGFEGDAFISKAHFTKYPKPFYVPYRCLYSRNVPNLFMAGRNVSVTHEALGSVRVMRTGGLMGEVVGLAAACCKAHHTDPRQIYENHWEDFRNRLLAGVGAKS